MAAPDDVPRRDEAMVDPAAGSAASDGEVCGDSDAGAEAGGGGDATSDEAGGDAASDEAGGDATSDEAGGDAAGDEAADGTRDRLAGVAAPVSETERVESIDVLRGFALLGILLVNAMLYAHPFLFGEELGEAGYSVLDHIAGGFIAFAATGKFYALFSFLFGLGMIIQYDRAQARGARFGRLFARRLVVLLGIGVAHGVLIWAGDILTAYALVGFLLLLFAKRKQRTIAIWVGVIYGLITAAMIVSAIVAVVASPAQPEGGKTPEEAAELAATYDLYANGGYFEILADRTATYASMVARSLITFPLLLGMFLFGAYAGKRQLFRDPEANATALRRLAIAGGAIGLPAATVYMLTEGYLLGMPSAIWEVARLASYFLGGPALCLAYACGIALLFQRARWRRWLSHLAPVGRMALTSYLSQSVIFTLLCYGYGFGLYGQLRPAGGLALTIAVFAAQIAASRWWLARYRFGPVEWLWRSLTYRRRQPMRRGQPASLRTRTA